MKRFGFRKRPNTKPVIIASGGFLLVLSLFLLLSAQTSTFSFSSAFFSSGRDSHSCISRTQSTLYRKQTPYKPSPYLLRKLQQYENLHKHCGPHSLSYKTAVHNLKSKQPHNNTDCNYIVFLPCQGLGNRILSTTSAFLYALLTNRTLLVNFDHSMDNLFCQPFPHSSWNLPSDFPFQFDVNSVNQEYPLSYGHLLQNKSFKFNTSVDQMFLYLNGNADHFDNLFYCDEEQDLLSKIPWLVMKSDLYTVPGLFTLSSFENELDLLFPDRLTIFYHLGRYLFNPSDHVWKMITDYYNKHLAKAENTLGIQIRIFDIKSNPFDFVFKHIESCINDFGLMKKSSTSVLVTSLFNGYAEKLRKMYKVQVNQPSHLQRQRSSRNGHNVQAWLEMYLLSLCDELVTSAGSTFGYVAQGLRGITPLMVLKSEGDKKAASCFRDLSMEPCFHKPSYYDCKKRSDADPAKLQPYFRRCEDISWGIKLVNVTT